MIHILYIYMLYRCTNVCVYIYICIYIHMNQLPGRGGHLLEESSRLVIDTVTLLEKSSVPTGRCIGRG